mgnify:CR=1 FL=1
MSREAENAELLKNLIVNSNKLDEVDFVHCVEVTNTLILADISKSLAILADQKKEEKP